MFEKETLPLVEDLQRKNLLARDATLPTIKREMTRYLIKQQQKLTEVRLFGFVAINSLILSIYLIAYIVAKWLLVMGSFDSYTGYISSITCYFTYY